jgi:hypothetical protein
MPTYYIDFEGGNDANTGLSFAQRWQTITNGATAARIAPGDEIRVMASPDPTSIGSATWTGGGRPSTISISSSTNATPIVITTLTAHGLVAGDYVVVNGHTTNTNANGVWLVGTTPTSTTFQILQINGSNTTGNGVGGASGTVTKANNLVVKTASPLVQNIALCGGFGQKPAWTASANATATQSTALYKEGNGAASIAPGAAFTTGKAAYYTLPSTLDLSAYQQVTFWVQLNSGTLGAAGQAYVALCTDTIGNTVAHQCNIPALGTTGVWFPVTVNFGANLNAAIRSVAFYIVTDLGAQSFQIDNIVACKAVSSADSITLQSLVSKSDGTGDEAWYAIQSINYDVIMLANQNSNTSQTANIRGYNGATETVTTYKRETVETVAAPTATTSVSVVNDSGTAGNLITYSGGWNRTDMSTQTGQTWLDGQNGLGRALSPTSSQQYVSVDKINFCRYGTGFSTGASSFSFVDVITMYATANTSNGISAGSGSSNITYASIWSNNNGGTGVTSSSSGTKITDVELVANNTTDGISFSSGRYQNVGSVIGGNNGTGGSQGDISFNTCNNIVVETATLTNGISSTGIVATQSFNCFVNAGSTTGHAQGVFSFATSELNLNNFTINEINEVSASGVQGLVYSNRHDNTDNNSWIWQTGIGEINQQTAVVDSPATTAWRMRPTSGTTSAAIPVFLKLGTVVCAANSLVTVTARMRRDNTGLTMRLACPGGQISGVTTDVTSDMTAAANTWETVTITFTPTKAGGVDIYAQAFGGSTFSGYVCNLTASQA